MAGFVFACNLVYMVVGTLVAVRLLRLSASTGGVPERVIGVAMLSFAAVCQPLLMALSGAFGRPSPDAYRVLMLVAMSASAVTVVGMYVFAWRVFRPNARWAPAAVAMGAAVAGVAGIGSASQPPSWSGQPVDASWLALSAFNYVVCFVWAGGESLVYYVRMRRRAAIGLAEPEVQNRFGVWGAAMVAGALLSLVVGVLSAAGLRVGSDALPSLCVAASGLINSTGWWLSFAPPAAYLNWVRARAARA
jgi:hypothetical protein